MGYWDPLGAIDDRKFEVIIMQRSNYETKYTWLLRVSLIFKHARRKDIFRKVSILKLYLS